MSERQFIGLCPGCARQRAGIFVCGHGIGKRFAAAPIDHSNRVSTLLETVHRGSGGEMERLEALLGLVTQLIRVVLVADDLEGFSSDETAALRFAAFLGGLRQSVDRLDVILSLNRDIWESAFVPRLSGGLADRLSEVVVELEPLDEAEMAADLILELSGALELAEGPTVKFARDVLLQIQTKSAFEGDTPQIRRLKGLLRRGEACASLQTCGVGKERIRFLDLGFYERGRYRQFAPQESDLAAVVQVLLIFDFG